MKNKEEILALADTIYCMSGALKVCLKDEYERKTEFATLALIATEQYYMSKKLLGLLQDNYQH